MERAAVPYLRCLLALGLAIACGLGLVACGVTPTSPRGVLVDTTPPDYSNFAIETPMLPPNAILLTILPPTVTPVVTSTPAVRKIAVYINGAVEKPGVYTFAEGSRVVDALQAAGGFLPTAEGDSINQAAPLRDGQQVYVPFKGTPPPPGLPAALPAAPPTGRAAAPAPVGPVNLNTAGPEELDTLPGIGPALADRIIEYRQKNGPFQRPEDLKKVSGIGDKVYENLKERITAP